MAESYDEDIEYLISLEGTALVDIDPFRIDEEEGAIIIPCSDGDLFPDIFTHHARIQTHCRQYPRIHPLPRHGGVAVLAPDSIMVPTGSTLQEDHHREIDVALTGKGFKKIVGGAHGGMKRCMMADHCQMSTRALIRDMFLAKQALKERYAGRASVACYFTCYYGENYQRYGKKKPILTWKAEWDGWRRHAA